MSWLLRLFGIRPEPRPMREFQCPTCGHVQRWQLHGPDPVDRFLSGASVEWLEAAIERDLRERAA